MDEEEKEPEAGPTPEGQAGAPQLSDEEIAMLEQQMREIRMEDILTQTVVSVINLTARRIAKEDEVDLDQARLGIEAVRSLLPAWRGAAVRAARRRHPRGERRDRCVRRPGGAR